MGNTVSLYPLSKSREKHDHGYTIITEDEIQKLHHCPEWLEERDPKKRHNQRQRKAKKRDVMKRPTEKPKQMTKKERLSDQHRREMEMQQILTENDVEKFATAGSADRYTPNITNRILPNREHHLLDCVESQDRGIREAKIKRANQSEPNIVPNAKKELESHEPFKNKNLPVENERLKLAKPETVLVSYLNENAEHSDDGKNIYDTSSEDSCDPEMCELLYDRKKSEKMYSKENIKSRNRYRLFTRKGIIYEDNSQDSDTYLCRDVSDDSDDSEKDTDDEWFDTEDIVLLSNARNSRGKTVPDTATMFEESYKMYVKSGKVKTKSTILDTNILKNGIDLHEHYLEQFAAGRSKTDGFYKTYQEHEEILSYCAKQPHLYKRCIIDIQSAHLAICRPVNTDDPIKKIEISGRSKCGQAFCEDEVVVKIINTERYKEQRPKTQKTAVQDTPIYGEVIGVLERTRFRNVPNPVFICVLDEMEGHLMKPVCKTVPKIHIFNSKVLKKYPKLKKHKIEAYKYDELHGKLEFMKFYNINPADRRKYIFVVALVCWGPTHIYPLGAVIDVLHSNENDYDNIQTGLKVIGLQYQVPTFYTKQTVESVKSLLVTIDDADISLSSWKDREDLSQSIDVFTIDPSNANDLDDALSVTKLDRDIYNVGIHIADVSSVVKKGDNIDKEAAERATSFYPGQGFKPYHMLPEPLSQNFCSLLPGKKRLAVSVFFKFNSSGKIIEKPEIKKTIVMSKLRLTYKEAQNIIVDPNTYGEQIREDIKILFAIAITIRRKRLKDAMHALPVEVDPFLDSDNVMESLEAHLLIEEFMILANTTIGKYVRSYLPDCALIRCQDEPSDESIKGWMDSHPYIADILFHLQNKKVSDIRELSIKHAKNARYTCLISLQKWVWKDIESAIHTGKYSDAWKLLATDEIHPEQALALDKWFSLQENAEYRCSGNLDYKDDKHFTLAVDNYTHFTSPIRRYSDLIVHRLLHSILNEKQSPYSKQEVVNLCKQINMASKRAKEYQKQCKTLIFAHSLNENPRIFNGFVQEISDREIVLYFPGLRFIPKMYREIRFAFLDISSKPQIATENNELRPVEDIKRDSAIVMWQKRLYRHSGFALNSKEENEDILIIDPHQRTSFLRYKDFLPILKSLTVADTKRLQDTVENIQHEVDYEMCKSWLYPKEKHVTEVTSEVKKGLITKHHCEFKLSVHINQVVAIQMSAEPRLGSLVPSPQIFDITSDVKCCLSHICDPVKTLAQYATLPTKSTYHSLQEYIRTWLPVLEMESATNAIEDSVTINNMQVQFKDRQGKFSHRRKYFDARDIDFEAMPGDFLKTLGNETDDADDTIDKNKKDQGYIKLSCSDYLCIRYPLSTIKGTDWQGLNPSCQKIWLGHASITKLRKYEIDHKDESFREGKIGKERKRKENKDEMIDVVFKLHQDAPYPPVSLAKTTDHCCVEILFKTQVDRRTESFLKMIEDAGPLVKAIALGNQIPELDEAHLNISRRMASDIEIDNISRNNNQQNKAIEKTLNSSFSLIQGPPGTGKTFTGIKLVYLFNEFNSKLAEETTTKKKQIVFCGPSNKSVDLVARWMADRLGNLAPKMIRMYGSTFEQLDFPVPGRAVAPTRRTRNVKIDESLMLGGHVLHWAIREDGKTHAAELRLFDAKFKNPKLSKEVTLKDLRRYEKILREAKQEELTNYNVIFCTTAVAASPKFLQAVNKRIYQCIIDECGMCTEPESIVPIIATQAKQVVLIGDHKQLRPIIKCRHAAELGLEKSIFERYAEMNKHLVMLKIQYRMNPFICQFPSDKFYDGKLETGRSPTWLEDKPLKIWRRETKFKDPVLNHIPHLFCHIEGEEDILQVTTEEGNEQSRSNLAEVEQVIKIFKYLTDVEEVDSGTINVISQYNAQCHALKAAFKKNKLENVLVNTVVSSQGGEWDYVIFSLVRSLPIFLIEANPTIGWCMQNLGFITDKNQINVALTRARKGLIIIGNQNLLRCDVVWRDLIKHYEARNCVIRAEEFPPQKSSKTTRSGTKPKTMTSQQITTVLYSREQ